MVRTIIKGKTPAAATPDPAPVVRLVSVDDGSAGQRLDNFLLRELKGVPKTHVYRIIRAGEVRVNKGRAAADTRLALGDVQWLVICYVLVYGSLMLVCGKLGDLFGHRLVFRIGLAISAVGCAACAAAPDWPLFLWARGAQGIGTALAPSALNMSM
ncbi:MAG: MFS transporter [Acidobacteria bacterium]|nr:MFS transporter [Acidobacteriota bacterium]